MEPTTLEMVMRLHQLRSQDINTVLHALEDAQATLGVLEADPYALRDEVMEMRGAERALKKVVHVLFLHHFGDDIGPFE